MSVVGLASFSFGLPAGVRIHFRWEGSLPSLGAPRSEEEAAPSLYRHLGVRFDENIESLVDEIIEI